MIDSHDQDKYLFDELDRDYYQELEDSITQGDILQDKIPFELIKSE